MHAVFLASFYRTDNAFNNAPSDTWPVQRHLTSKADASSCHETRLCSVSGDSASRRVDILELCRVTALPFTVRMTSCAAFAEDGESWMLPVHHLASGTADMLHFLKDPISRLSSSFACVVDSCTWGSWEMLRQGLSNLGLKGGMSCCEYMRLSRAKIFRMGNGERRRGEFEIPTCHTVGRWLDHFCQHPNRCCDHGCGLKHAAIESRTTLRIGI